MDTPKTGDIIVRSIKKLLKLKTKRTITSEEYKMLGDWIKNQAMLEMDSYDYACLLGWWTVGDWSIPLSRKEAGLD